MPIQTTLTSRFELRQPIIQAPLAGGGDTPALVAAVCDAGALGFIGGAYLTPGQLAEAARRVRARTDRPFGVNLFAPQPAVVTAADGTRALELIAAYCAELGLPTPEVPSPPADTFDDQLAAALETGAAAFSFTLGVVPAPALAAVKARGMFSMGTATTVSEAVALERAGVDAIVAQGSEAGGHRATFGGDFQGGLVSIVALVPAIADAVQVPIVASGGIMDGRGIAAALALGAAGVQLGTAFLTCDEAGIPETYKRAILGAREDGTRLTRAFSGRPARGIVNRFMTEVEGAGDDAILPFPLQNALTRPLRAAAARLGRAEFLSLWAGQGVRLARRQPAAELIARLGAETAEAVERLAAAR
jgi:nitronate monooxygenase